MLGSAASPSALKHSLHRIPVNYNANYLKVLVNCSGTWWPRRGLDM